MDMNREILKCIKVIMILYKLVSWYYNIYDFDLLAFNILYWPWNSSSKQFELIAHALLIDVISYGIWIVN